MNYDVTTRCRSQCAGNSFNYLFHLDFQRCGEKQWHATDTMYDPSKDKSSCD